MKLTVLTFCVLFLLPAMIAAQEAAHAGNDQAQAKPAQRQQSQAQRRRNRNRATTQKPTHANVHYGPHESQVLDLWLASSDQPTPLLVCIHGGGFRGGEKYVPDDVLKGCLDSGISVAAITYRFSRVAKAPAQFEDAARAIQFLRHQAKEWNLDPSRIAAIGNSAGAGLSLWLGFHDDVAQPDSDDPVLRQSSRVTCVSVFNAQSTYDPRVLREWFSGTDTYKHPALAQLYDVNLDELDNLPPEKYRLFEETSALPHVTRDDVPVLMVYLHDYDTPIRNQGIGIHHPKFGKELKDRMDKLGIPCEVHVNNNRDDWGRLTVDFVKKHLLSAQH